MTRPAVLRKKPGNSETGYKFTNPGRGFHLRVPENPGLRELADDITHDLGKNAAARPAVHL